MWGKLISQNALQLRMLRKEKKDKLNKMLKPGKNDIIAFVKFEADELELLQENTWQIAESYGLDSRIDNLTGKRKVGFYRWDLDLLEDVVGDLTSTPATERLYEKIKNGIDFIDEHD